jgi:hypothetical protein
VRLTPTFLTDQIRLKKISHIVKQKLNIILQYVICVCFRGWFYKKRIIHPCRAERQYIFEV